MKTKLVFIALALGLGLTLTLLVLTQSASAQEPGPTLFVDNSSDGAGASVLIYDGVNAADGNVAPNRKLWNPLSAAPYGVWYDAAGDRLFVSVPSKHCILVFDQAGAAGGPTRPDRIIVGPNTLLNYPNGLFLDVATDRLYVASYMNSRILVFDNASSAGGDVVPARAIGGPTSTLLGPRGLTLDLAADRLYVANSYADTVVIFDSASTLDGDAAPARIVSGDHTLLRDPRGIEVDPVRDQLYVVNRTDSYDPHRPVVVFTATTASGNITPTRTIAHNDLFYPTGSFLLSDTLYIATEPYNAIHIYDNVSTLSGTITPTRELRGVLTTLITVRNLFIDPASDDMYVANYTSVNVTGYVPVFANASTINGAVAPERIIEEASRLGFNVLDLHFDAAHDRLYVLHDPNGGDDSIQVYDHARSVDGDVPPTRLMTTTFHMRSSLAVDAEHDLVYIPGYDPSTSSNGIGVFSDIGSASGQVTPTRFLTHTTWLDSYGVQDLAVDIAHDRLYVLRAAYADGQIMVFDGISSANGEIVPTRIISGPSTLVGKRSLNMALDVSGDRLYVSAYEPDFIAVFEGVSSADGDVAPSRVISGPNTLLDFPAGLALDVAADTLYVSNSQKPYHVSIFENASTAGGDVAPTRVISGSDTGLYYPRALALGAVPDLVLTKTSHATEIDPNNPITYNLTYINTMTDTIATSAFITDDIPAYTSFITCAGGLSCGPAGDIVGWSLGDVPTRSGGIVTLTLWLSDMAPPGARITNTAIFSSPTASGPAIATAEVRVGWPFDLYLPLVLRDYGP